MSTKIHFMLCSFRVLTHRNSDNVVHKTALLLLSSPSPGLCCKDTTAAHKHVRKLHEAQHNTKTDNTPAGQLHVQVRRAL